MSNNSYLLTTAGPDKPSYGEGSASRGLLVASTSIPVFWYLLFDETSLVLGPGVGVRCVVCGLMGHCAGWEEWHGTEMFDEV